MIDINLHTHTYRCRHARGDAADYCAEAVARGLRTLGFSDHTPLPDGRWSSVRMAMGDLPGYCRAVEAAARAAAADGLRVLKGLECEFVPEFTAFYREELLGAMGLDYLIGGAHWYPHRGEWRGIYGTAMTPEQLRAYADYQITAMQSGLFAFIAHPDLFGVAWESWDRAAAECSKALLTAAAALGMPLEINGYGLRKPPKETPSGSRPMYPWRPFWELAAECGVAVVLSSDAHTPADVAAGLDDAAAMARRLGLRVVSDPLARLQAAT
ncbi:MAG: histidinol-phosphatase [Lentisphaerae bacterium]|nr:histidinol-phosphatase [Lentisphaerota bacterium]